MIVQPDRRRTDAFVLSPFVVECRAGEDPCPEIADKSSSFRPGPSGSSYPALNNLISKVWRQPS